MTNWSLVLNVLLLMGVLVALLRMVHLKHREKSRHRNRNRYPVEAREADAPQDDIIAVRKLNVEEASDKEASPADVASKDAGASDSDAMHTKPVEEAEASASVSVMLFLLAKDNRQLGGYDLLQSLLAAGLRFGDEQLFHRHQFSNGQGPIICSLAAATDSGVFDLQNMANFSTRGLCLFMASSGNASIDAERLTIMLDTAKQLSASLDAYLLDDARKPWSEESLLRYQQQLDISMDVEVTVG